MEAKTCKTCGRELPSSNFKMTRWGNRASICNECLKEKRAETRCNRAQVGGGKTAPFPDPDFDGKEPREVIQLMSRAKKWLESRGFVIQLSGEFHETKIRKLKFE